ncbi:hypothetical protein CcaverHIS002_0212860 [Cutaneotrichosporon cavernicola]|uniref:Uncharacterized protein n=1 Tax=Cutaneotrichosporon cavernicola TaxID=279322 RepID=A0AA48I5B6_9TREE|nr:uncharacterized protein CcaverHIS019_0212860 [Cutaneotrichosporon cavernicola]BEI82126.1 hypothetical protein CcaverHIS002_0212860 [Cutaneotrichosporon cavernicola]BEI89924.1 hypothetical protein CcaverHIS019_0212860 [Cutaneotrichosporon cavernicola]BEI97695.1 hypothetical protein CcaverHIS631_0212840 [Cutaneotrichosporon cavernicola]BEJ05472.1 hypothetical protein CcaverHIS641_0212890 [Cutaneotrichosporon cavernicola]
MPEKVTASDTTLKVVPIPPSLTPPSEGKSKPKSVEEQRKHLKESVRQLMEALITFDTALDSPEPPTSVELIAGLGALALVIYIVCSVFFISLAITDRGMYLRFT